MIKQLKILQRILRNVGSLSYASEGEVSKILCKIFKANYLLVFIFVIFSFFSLHSNTVFVHAASDGLEVNLSVDGTSPSPTPSPSPSGGGRAPLPPAPLLPTNNDITPPQNVNALRAVVSSRGINLFWMNPPDEDFAYVRLVRNEDRFHGDPFLGKLIYEGTKQSFLDGNVLAGKKYFYTIFSRDTTGNFSSGGAVSAIAFSLGHVAPSLLPDQNFLPNSQFLKWTTHQYNKQVEILSNTIPIMTNGDENVIIDTEAAINSDYFLIVTGEAGKNLGQYMFSFNKESGRYQSIIPPLKKMGTYTVTILKYTDSNLQIIGKGLLYILSDSIPQKEQFIKNICNTFNCNYFKFVGLILLLIILLFILKRIS